MHKILYGIGPSMSRAGGSRRVTVWIHARRSRHLLVALTRPASTKPIHVLIDSTGIKILGACVWREWQRYIPGTPHDFRKLHLALDAHTHEMVAV